MIFGQRRGREETGGEPKLSHREQGEKEAREVTARYERELETAFEQMLQRMSTCLEKYNSGIFEITKTSVLNKKKGFSGYYIDESHYDMRAKICTFMVGRIHVICDLRFTSHYYGKADIRSLPNIRLYDPKRGIMASIEKYLVSVDGLIFLRALKNKDGSPNRHLVDQLNAVSENSIADYFGLAATELESASAPGGRGTEPSQASAPIGMGSELIAEPNITGTPDTQTQREDNSETEQSFLGSRQETEEELNQRRLNVLRSQLQQGGKEQ
ncbi:MAG TPA: hypothetical protein PK263_04470 [bacterium]|nr:hypothetical protein [bacterium]